MLRRFASALGSLVLALLLLAACGRGPATDAGPLRVVVSIAPLTSLAADLAPPGSVVTTLIPVGRSLHGYEITPGDVAGLGRADVVVHIGPALDRMVGGFLRDHPSGDRSDVCFMEAVGLEGAGGAHGDEPDEHGGAGGAEDHVAHEDEADEDGAHEDGAHAFDPHLWLDPSLVARLVPVLRKAVEDAQERRGALDETERARLDAAEADLLSRVAALDREYAQRLAPFAGRAIVTHHDAFRRVADRYGLRIAAVIRPIESAEATPAAIAGAASAARAEGARAVFFEPQFEPDAARRIAEAAGARLGRLDPEGDSDWFGLMRANLDSLVSNLGE